LVELQKLDTQILSLSRKVDSIPAHIAADEAVYKQAQKAHDAVTQQQQTLEKKKKEKERQVEDLNEKIAKLRARAPEIKTNKEFQANLKEIEAFETQIRAIEDELLNLMEALETAASGADEENRKFAAAKAEAEALGKDREAEIKKAGHEIQALKVSRKELSEKIDPEFYGLYMTLLKSKRGLAVSEVAREICQGCMMNIPPQLFVRIKAGGDIFQCPQCRRILYYVKPPSDNQEAEAGSKTEA
jgi:predicted  nucleic acid-binding Zn-ribbon protein